MGQQLQERAPLAGSCTSHKCSLTWHYSVGCKPTEVVPY